MTSAERTVTPGSRKTDDRYAEPNGWLWFSGIILMLAGIMRFFDAIWAFTYKGSVANNLQNAIFGHTLKTYGWLWLAVAIVLFLSGVGVMVRNQVARWVGVAAGGIGAISSVWWMPYYPVWSLVYTGLGVAVIYGLVVHAKDAD